MMSGGPCIGQTYIPPSQLGCGMPATSVRATRGYIKQGVWYPHNRSLDFHAPKDPYSPMHCDRVGPFSTSRKLEIIGNPPGLATPNKQPLSVPDMALIESPPGLFKSRSDEDLPPPTQTAPPLNESFERQHWCPNEQPSEADRSQNWRSQRSLWSRSPSPNDNTSWRSSLSSSVQSYDESDTHRPVHKSLTVRINGESKHKSHSCPASRCHSPLSDQLAFSAPATPAAQLARKSSERSSMMCLPEDSSSTADQFKRGSEDVARDAGDSRRGCKAANGVRTNKMLNGAVAALAAAQKALVKAQNAGNENATPTGNRKNQGAVSGQVVTAAVPSVVKAALSSTLLKKQWAPNPPTEFDDKVSEAKKLISSALKSQLVKESTYDRWAANGPGYDSSEYWHLLQDEHGNWKEMTVELLLQIPQPPPPARSRPVSRPVDNPVKLAHMVHNSITQKELFDQLPLSLAALNRSKSTEGLTSMEGDLDVCAAAACGSSNPATCQSSATSTPREPGTPPASEFASISKPVHTSTPSPAAYISASAVPATTPSAASVTTPVVAVSVSTPVAAVSASTPVVAVSASTPVAAVMVPCTPPVAHAITITPSTASLSPASASSTQTPIQQASLSSWQHDASTPSVSTPAAPALEEDEDSITADSDMSDSSSPSSQASIPSSINSTSSSADPLVKYYQQCLPETSQMELEEAVEKGLSGACCHMLDDEDDDGDDFFSFSCPSIVMAELMGASRLVSV